jgi:rod shape-determining protein MreC
MPQGSFKITRGKGSGQLPLAIVAILAVILVLVGKAQSPLFNRIRAGFSDLSRPVLEAARTPFDIGARWASGLGNVFDVYQENLALTAQNQRLRHWQTAALLLEERIKRYQQLLHVVPDPALKTVTARVIGHVARPFAQTLILDAGARDGLHPGEAVIAPSGMVGRIFVTGQRTAWVILLTDLNSRVPVRTVKGDVHAILTGDNTPTPLLDTVSDPAKLKAGDQVVTSGDGGLLPPNLPIGVVVKDGEVKRVVLFADPATTDDVSIVTYKHQPGVAPKPGTGGLPQTPLSVEAASASSTPAAAAVPVTPGGAAVTPPGAAAPTVSPPVANQPVAARGTAAVHGPAADSGTVAASGSAPPNTASQHTAPPSVATQAAPATPRTAGNKSGAASPMATGQPVPPSSTAKTDPGALPSTTGD